jgi:hypothetical protein
MVQAESGFVNSSYAIQISTLSSRPQLVSGGNVLASIKLPQSFKQSQLRVTLNGIDIANAFIVDDVSHSLLALANASSSRWIERTTT